MSTAIFFTAPSKMNMKMSAILLSPISITRSIEWALIQLHSKRSMKGMSTSFLAHFISKTTTTQIQRYRVSFLLTDCRCKQRTHFVWTTTLTLKMWNKICPSMNRFSIKCHLCISFSLLSSKSFNQLEIHQVFPSADSILPGNISLSASINTARSKTMYIHYLDHCWFAS